MKKPICVYSKDPRYWEYNGRPVLLIGGSKEDNLFQIPDIKEHLDLLHSKGGNYVRCTMSSRDAGNILPFEKQKERYDLEKPSKEYGRRFSEFLKLACERDIILQIEVWDRFDFHQGCWDTNAFNPKNNINYTAEESGLPEHTESPGWKEDNPFFTTIPAADNNQVILKYQKKYVDELLGHSLDYPNVLYCMDNETTGLPAWSQFWSDYIKAKAKQRNLKVNTTEMWDAHDLTHKHHKRTLDHPETYDFCDISQNNHNKGDAHWEGIQFVRNYLHPPRPMNCVKVYGSDVPYQKATPNSVDGVRGLYGRASDGLERMWRNLFGGCAASRFHRPPSGNGLSQEAQAHIKSLRMLTDELFIFDCEPHNDLLQNRKAASAFACAKPGEKYAVYFPHGDCSCNINLSHVSGTLTSKWLDIQKSRWVKTETVQGGNKHAALIPPVMGHCGVLIK